MHKKINHTSLFILFICSWSNLFAQQENLIKQTKITLIDVIQLANNHSLEVFKAKRQYGVNFWEFKSFKASLLPEVNFNTTPFTFNRSLVERYDSEQNVDVFRQQQNINSFANISLSQNIALTNTQVYLNSSFNRLENFGDFAIKNYTATPVRIGLSQPILAFNPFKWEQKIAPLEYQKARQDFIYELQEINLKAVNLFFSWALASKQVEIAKENKISTEKLFKIGKKRYQLIAIERNDLLNLELDVYNATTTLTQNQQNLQKAAADLKLFLRDQFNENSLPQLPELVSNLQINVDKAIEYAYQNNPDILDIQLQKTKALRDLDQVIKENRFDLSVNASYGLNQQANTFIDVYGRFLDQQMVSVNFSVPLLDWGERKGNIQTAKMNKDVIDIELQQNEDTYKQDITLNVLNFNAQKDLVVGALRSATIAKESYELTQKRFLSGNVDFLALSASRTAWQNANENYIKILQQYWTLYYKVQQLTLYNFINKNPLTQDFEKILKNDL